MSQEELIIEKAHCPHCGFDVCRESDIHLLLQFADGKRQDLFPSKVFGNYDIKSAIPLGTKTTVLCPHCEESLHPADDLEVCKLVNSKMSHSSFTGYTIVFFSEIGQHGTILMRGDVVEKSAGAQREELGHLIHHWNQVDADHARIMG